MHPRWKTLDRFGALRSGGIAHRNGLRSHGLLARLLRHRLFLNWQQWFASNAVENVHPSLLGVRRESFARLAVIDLVEKV
jgi:hypothetical protein